MVNIRIGLVGTTVAGWRLLLDQEGVPYESCTDLTAERYSAIVVAADMPESSIDEIRGYLSRGGSVLCSMDIFSKITGIAGKKQFIRYIIEEKHPFLSAPGLIDLDAYGMIHPQANHFRMGNGEYTVHIGSYGGGNIIVLPVDAGDSILDGRTAPKSFYTRRYRLPYEEVARVSKGGIRLLVSRALILLHQRRSLPYIHRWYFPHDAPTVFGWRIDTDYANEQQVRTLAALLGEYSIPATWCIDVKSQESILTFYKTMDGHEIAVHCYDHLQFPDLEHNLADLKHAIQVLNGEGMIAHGYAAPYGRWKSGLQSHLPELGIEYSSEFSYDYDNIPSFPVVAGIPEPSLQIPVHPISVGNLRRQGFDDQEMFLYYQLMLEQLKARNLPLMLYYHPGNGHHPVVRAIFDAVRESSFPVMTMIEYARWWNNRNALKLSCTIEDQHVYVDMRASQDVWLRIIHPDGREAVVRPSGRIDLNSVHWKPVGLPVQMPSDIERIRKFNQWILLQSFEDATIGKLRRRASSGRV